MAKKLQASANFKNRERKSGNNKYNFHTISDQDKQEISEAINNTDDTSKTLINVVDNQVGNKINTLFPTSLNKDIDLNDLIPAPDDWNYFPLPDIETLKLIAKSIYAQGQLSPGIVWEQGNGQYMILGGHTRFAILKYLKEAYPDEADRFSKMHCHVYSKNQIDDNAAQYIIVMNNMTQRAKEAPSLQVKSIVKAFNLQKELTKKYWGEYEEYSNERVAKNFGISHATVDRLYRLRTLIPEFMALLDNGELPKGIALQLSCLPDEVQLKLFNNELYSNKFSNEHIKSLMDGVIPDDIKNPPKNKFYFIGGKTYLPYNIPKEFNKISIAIDKQDYDIFRDIILKNINKFNNPDSKKILKDILN